MLVSTHEPSTTGWSPTMNRKTQSYYKVRSASADYSGYWGTVTDPDGNVRDRLSAVERRKWIIDNSDLLLWCKENIARGARCLDVGSGPGWLGAMLPFAKWHAIEPNTEAWEHAIVFGYRMRIHSLQYATIELYDCVVMNHVIEHMPDPLSAIKQVHRTLKRGGHLVLGTPDFGSPCALRFGEKYRLLHDATHCSLFTNESMHRFLRDNGFTIERVEYPFPDRYATAENMQRWLDGPAAGMSPPWPGNCMTFYCRK